jgi:hypothetical protein
MKVRIILILNANACVGAKKCICGYCESANMSLAEAQPPTFFTRTPGKAEPFRKSGGIAALYY